MEIREIESRDELEAFLKRIKPHTFLASWQWGEFEEKTGSKAWCLGAYEGGKLVAAATISKTIARRGTFLVWHHGPVIDSSVIASTRSNLLHSDSRQIASRSAQIFADTCRRYI